MGCILREHPLGSLPSAQWFSSQRPSRSVGRTGGPARGCRGPSLASGRRSERCPLGAARGGGVTHITAHEVTRWRCRLPPRLGRWSPTRGPALPPTCCVALDCGLTPLGLECLTSPRRGVSRLEWDLVGRAWGK